MAIITDITTQKRNKQRASIFIDGQFFCGIDMLAVASHGLKIGTEVAEDKLLTAISDSERYSAFTRSIDYISRGRKTIKQMRDYLLSKQYNADIVAVVIDKLINYKYLDDSAYCASYVEANKATKGTRRIKQELIVKGINAELADKYVVDCSDEEQSAEVLTAKYMRNKTTDLATKSKLYRYLLSRGFNYSVVSVAVDNYYSQHTE